MTARLAQNKLFVVLALAALAILAFGAASAAMGSSWIGSTVTGSQLPRERAELVDGYVAWDVHDASGALVASGGSANEITQAGLDALLGEIGNGATFGYIGILQDNAGACTLPNYGPNCVLADATHFNGDRVREVGVLIGPVAGDDGDLPASVIAEFSEDHRVKGVASFAFEAIGADGREIDAIVLTSSSAGGVKPDAATLFAFNNTGWTIPTAGSTITFRWYIGVLAD